jgi:hypothetical protein
MSSTSARSPLLQGVSDVAPSLRLAHFVYEVLGQRLEKFLGHGFLLRCVVLLLFDCCGGTKLLGSFLLAVVLGVEFYSIYMAHVGHPVTGLLKLCYVLLFAWLLLESRKKANGFPR